MTNLIYINEDSFCKKSLNSKIIFLFLELTFYFDCCNEMRIWGFNIASKIFDQNNQVYKKVLVIKKYLALLFRLLILLTSIYVGYGFLGENSNFLGRIVFIISVMTGVLLYAFLFSKNELFIIDKSLDIFSDNHYGDPKIAEKDNEKKNVPLEDLDKTHEEQKENLTKDEDLNKDNQSFFGFPIELLVKLFDPLKDGSLEEEIKITESQYERFHNIMIYDINSDPIVIPRGKHEYFRTYFYCIYDLLQEIRYKYPYKGWKKKVFYEQLKKAVVNYKNYDETSLRVHDNMIDFSSKTKKHLRSLIE